MTKNIFLPNTPEVFNYTPSRRVIPDDGLPERNRKTHSQYLKNQLKKAWKEIRESKKERLAVSLPVRNGTYLEFEGSPGFLLNIKSLEDRRSKIKLLNSRIEENGVGEEIHKATVYVPEGKENYFLKKIKDYQEDTLESGKPKNYRLIDTISDIRGAILESFWIGKKEWIPNKNPVWCEIWLRNEEDRELVKNLMDAIIELNIEIKDEEIYFPERKVILVKANRNELIEIISRSDVIAEIRRASETNSFFTEIENKDQVEWTNDLINRVNKDIGNVFISILDTGLNNGNPLLNYVVEDGDIHSYFKDSGNDIEGHGTKMGGVSVYNDLKESLMSQEKIILTHGLESMKILPDGRENEPELFGAITSQSVSNLYIEKPNRKRIICMAITAPDYTYTDGRPSSWSAAIDDLIHGTMDNIQKVFLVSAGNVRQLDKISDYPDSNLIETIEDPGQSWNAITVGAYTNLDKPIDSTHNVIAHRGEISPFSRTSELFNDIWPIKPEVVLEGGNAVKLDNVGYTDENLSILTSHHDPSERIFTITNGTSAATALASWMAAKIQSEYPEAWPETVRALLIHSAEWTQEMENQFIKGSGSKKSDYKQLLRTCGYGVPNLNRAVETVNNRVNLIIQSEIQPYEKREDGSYATKEMHLHELPWPKEELLAMFNTPVRMKVTLSYFIEPGPGEKGWKDKYRYPSCGLRFDLNGSSDKDSFLKRVNSSLRDENDPGKVESNVNWKLGQIRNVGSIHSDTWVGTASELASSNYIGVFPVIGWWRERGYLNKWNHKVKYSLVVTLDTPETEVDLLTPIRNKVEAKVKADISNEITY